MNVLIITQPQSSAQDSLLQSASCAASFRAFEGLKHHLDLMFFLLSTTAWTMFFCLASLRLAVKLWDLNVRCQIKPDVHHVIQDRKQYVFALKAFIDCKYFY